MKIKKNTMLTENQAAAFLSKMAYQVEIDGVVCHKTGEVQRGDITGGTAGEVLAVYEIYSAEGDEWVRSFWVTDRYVVHGKSDAQVVVNLRLA